jgi:small conductance mechanosensitive channel
MEEYIMDTMLNTVKDWATLYGLKVIGALVILVLGRLAISIINGIVGRVLRRANIDETLSKFIRSLTKIALMTFVVVAALNTLGVATASVIAIIGAAGLAVGFALQGSLANFASGVMLIIFRPFKSGDYIDAGGTSGLVQEISIFNTILKTPDNIKIVIPNGSVTGGNITNYSAEETRRVDLVFGVSYGDDLKKARQILERLVGSDERILKDPAPVIAVSELADSSVNFVVRPWVKTKDYWSVYWDLTEKVKLTFDAEGISIPFPQRDIHMHQVVEQGRVA